MVIKINQHWLTIEQTFLVFSLNSVLSSTFFFISKPDNRITNVTYHFRTLAYCRVGDQYMIQGKSLLAQNGMTYLLFLSQVSDKSIHQTIDCIFFLVGELSSYLFLVLLPHMLLCDNATKMVFCQSSMFSEMVNFSLVQ